MLISLIVLIGLHLLMTYAINFEKKEAVKVLIANGANLDLCNGVGRSPLSKAISRNNLEIGKILVENGAKINSNYVKGMTPFQKAIKEKKLEMIHLLMENGADMKIRTKNSKNNAIELALKEGEINIVKKLIY